MKQAAATKLPEIEWKFDRVHPDERWMCVLWEFGRSSKLARLSLSNYTSQSAAYAVDAAVIGFPLSLRLLHRALATHANFEKTIRPVLDSGTQAEESVRYPHLALRKARAFQWLEDSDWIDPIRENLLDLTTSLSAESAEAMVSALRNLRVGAQLVTSAEFERIVKKFRGKVSADGYLCPFPNTPWLKLDLRSRRVLLESLTNAEFVVDVDDWVRMVQGGSDPAAAVLAPKYPFLNSNYEKKKKSGRTAACPGRLRNNGLDDLSLKFELLRSAKHLREFKSIPKTDEAILNLLINWRLTDEELVGKFRHLLSIRPSEFATYAKGQWSDTRGPRGLELTGNDQKAVTPEAALRMLGVWRRFRPRETETKVRLKDFISMYYDLRGDGGKLSSLEASLSRDRRHARAILANLFGRESKI